MSIIYDALKKVEKTNPADHAKNNKWRINKNDILLYLFFIVAVCLGFFIANAFWGKFEKKPVIAQTKTPQAVPSLPVSPSLAPISQPEPQVAFSPRTEESHHQPGLALNGIFFSQDKGYALVNNIIVKEGDTIEGATVKRISADTVEFESYGKTFQLRTK